jgi:dTDP-4-amino-4,6-dideoxygalactose transaminase
MQIWSFHPAKTITTGEGGAVTTNDEKLYKTLLRLRTHGITRDTTQYVNENEGGWYYEMLDLGFNYRITDIQCALGVSQLKKLPRFSKRRTEIVEQYNNAFKDIPAEPQQSPEWSQATRHLYTIRLKNNQDRRAVFDKLQEKGIGVNVHYIPVHLLPYYKKLGYEKGLCPIAEDSYNRMITLPLFPSMSDEMVEYVIKSVKEVVL